MHTHSLAELVVENNWIECNFSLSWWHRFCGLKRYGTGAHFVEFWFCSLTWQWKWTFISIYWAKRSAADSCHCPQQEYIVLSVSVLQFFPEICTVFQEWFPVLSENYKARILCKNYHFILLFWCMSDREILSAMYFDQLDKNLFYLNDSVGNTVSGIGTLYRQSIDCRSLNVCVTGVQCWSEYVEQTQEGWLQSCNNWSNNYLVLN
jgi:hypothetical protein